MKKRTFIKKLHFYIALLSALPLLVLSISGSLLVYREPIDDWLTKPYMDVPIGSEKLSIASMEGKLKEELSGKEFAGVVLPLKEGKSYYFWLKDAPFWTVAYVDPYTGAFKGIRAWEDWTIANLIWWLTDLHYSFKWGQPGSYAVGASSVVLALSLLSGIFLWWPRQSRFVRNKFTLRTGRRWKQTAYNFHGVIGIYFAVILLAICITGVSITFWEPMRKLVHAVTLSPPPREHPTVKPLPDGKLLPYEEILVRAQDFLRNQHGLAPLPQAISFAATDNAAVEVSFQGNPSLAWADHYHVWVHAQTGEIVGSEVPTTFNRGEKVVSWIGAIHFGSWGAIFGTYGDHVTRILWLIAAMVPIFLMISGFSIVKKSQWQRLFRKNGEGQNDN